MGRMVGSKPAAVTGAAAEKMTPLENRIGPTAEKNGDPLRPLGAGTGPIGRPRARFPLTWHHAPPCLTIPALPMLGCPSPRTTRQGQDHRAARRHTFRAHSSAFGSAARSTRARTFRKVTCVAPSLDCATRTAWRGEHHPGGGGTLNGRAGRARSITDALRARGPVAAVARIVIFWLTALPRRALHALG